MIQSIFYKLGSAILTGAITVGSLFGINPPVENLGATVPVVVATFESSLQSSITDTSTSMTLVSGTDAAGNALSGYICFNIDEGTALEEFVCGTAAGTSITSMIRGIDPVDGNLEVTALKKTHRRGATVKVTNYPSLGIVSRILAGTESLSNTLTYDTGITPVASGDLVDKEYADTLVGGGTLSFDRIVISGTAGETVSSGQLLYRLSTDSEWYLTDADTATTVENVMLGIAMGAGTDGNPITNGVLVRGIATNLSGLTANTIYYASNTAGGFSSTVGTKEVTVGIALSTTSMDFNPRFNQQLTEDEQDAISGGSTFGTPSATNKFITQDYNSSATGLPVIRVLTTTSSDIGGSTTQFDITNPSGTTFRYTYDSTGTDPTISCAANPIGSLVNLQAQNFTAANNGIFILTGCGTSYFEVTNASGVVESNKTIGTGYITESGTTTWSKPTGLKFLAVQVVGGGGGGGSVSCGGSCSAADGGGGGGGYSYELIPTASLSASEYYLIGSGGAADTSGRTTTFGNKIQATGGTGTTTPDGGPGGIGSLGDLNLKGGGGGSGNDNSSSGDSNSGAGGSSFLGGGGEGVFGSSQNGGAGGVYGGGGAGGTVGTNESANGGAGAQGVIILTEYFN